MMEFITLNTVKVKADLPCGAGYSISGISRNYSELKKTTLGSIEFFSYPER